MPNVRKLTSESDFRGLISRGNDFSLSFYNNGFCVLHLKYSANVYRSIVWALNRAKDRNGNKLQFQIVRVFERKSRRYLGTIIP